MISKQSAVALFHCLSWLSELTHEAFFSSMAIFINDSCCDPGLFNTLKFLVKMYEKSANVLEAKWSNHYNPLTLVPMRLQSRHLHPQNLFRLGRHFLDDILLQATQHQRPELVVKIIDLCLVRVVQVKVVCKLD